MLDEKLNSYVATYESAAWYLRGWLAICLPAYCGLTPSMNNNDAGYVNYETIIYSVGRVGYCRSNVPTTIDPATPYYYTSCYFQRPGFNE